MAANAEYWICAQTGVTPLAEGIPGVAKTAGVNAFAKAVKRKGYVLIGSIREPADIGGYPRITDDNGMELVPASFILAASKEPYVILVDELTSCPPAVQAPMLRMIAEKVVGDVTLHPKTLVLAACNPPEIAANGVDIEIPMANRVYHHKWKMDWDNWDIGMMNGLDFPAPSFPILPENWKVNIPQFGTLMVGFRKKRSTLFEDCPKERSKATKAWGSPRSWTYGAQCVAAAHSVNAEDTVKFNLLAGLVGQGGATEFFNWIRELDIPDPEELIKEAIKSNKTGKVMKYSHPRRADQVIAMLGAVSSAVLRNNTEERWLAGCTVIEQVFEKNPEIAISCFRPLHQGKPEKAELSSEFIDKIFPIIYRGMYNT
jgi:hypothetical protein